MPDAHHDPATDVSDAELLARWAQDRDPAAFTELVERHGRRLHSAARRVLHLHADAEDVVQNTWSQVARSAGTYVATASVARWLHRITINAALDFARHRASRGRGERAYADDRTRHASPPRPDVVAAGRERVATLLARLTEDQRDAVTLVDLHGFPVREAAEMLGVAEGTVKSRCARGRSRMAAVLADEDAAR